MKKHSPLSEANLFSRPEVFLRLPGFHVIIKLTKKRGNEMEHPTIIKQGFIALKERRLEKLIRGGILKQKDAHAKLCGFTDTVRKTMHWFEIRELKQILDI